MRSPRCWAEPIYPNARVVDSAAQLHAPSRCHPGPTCHPHLLDVKNTEIFSETLTKSQPITA